MATAETDLLRAGIAAAKAGRRVDARNLLIKVVRDDHNNEAAWLWLAGLVDRPVESLVCLENALLVNPGNEQVRQAIYFLRQQLNDKTGVPAQPLQDNSGRFQTEGNQGELHGRGPSFNVQPPEIVEGVIRPSEEKRANYKTATGPFRPPGNSRLTIPAIPQRRELNQDGGIKDGQFSGYGESKQTQWEYVEPEELEAETPEKPEELEAEVLEKSEEKEITPEFTLANEDKISESEERIPQTVNEAVGKEEGQKSEEGDEQRTRSLWNNKRSALLIGLTETTGGNGSGQLGEVNEEEAGEKKDVASGTSLAVVQRPAVTDQFVADMRVSSGMRAPSGFITTRSGVSAEEEKIAKGKKLTLTITTTVVLVILILSGISGGYYIYNRYNIRQAAETIPSGSPAEIAAQLRTYRGSTFQISYPQNWNIANSVKTFPQDAEKKVQADVVIFSPNTGEFSSIEVAAFKFETNLPQTIDDPLFLDFQKRTIASSGDFGDPAITETHIISPTAFYINTFPILRIDIEGQYRHTPARWSIIYIISGPHTIHIIEYVDTSERYIRFQPALEQMLQSFKA